MEHKDIILLIVSVVTLWIPLLVINDLSVLFYSVSVAIGGVAYWLYRKEMAEHGIDVDEPDEEMRKVYEEDDK